MGKIFYELYGDLNSDVDVILIHGWASSHTMWNNIHPHIENAKVWALDLPGFGQTSIDDHHLTIAEYAQSVIDFCDEHQIKPQLIASHSTGCMITFKMLLQRPELTELLLMIAPVVTGRFGFFGMPSDLLRTPFGVATLRATKQLWSTAQNDQLLNVILPWFHSDAELARRVKDNFIHTQPDAGIESLVSLAQEDMRDYLVQFDYPTLVCVGDNDLTVPPSEGRIAALYMPQAKIETFPAYHHPMDECTEEFVPILREFLEQYGL